MQKLRPYQEKDIVAWQKWDTDPEVQKFMPEPQNQAVSDEEQLSYLRECLNDQNGFELECVCKEARIKNNGPINTKRYFKLL